MIDVGSARASMQPRARSGVLCGFVWGASLLVGCTQGGAPSRVAELPAQKASAEPVGYDEGPWMSSDLNALALSAAQILVSHRDVKASRHFATGRPSARDRERALSKAKEIRLRLREHPEEFAALAARESDDWNTAAHGGDLGAFHASELPLPIANALGHLAPGEISRVVETDLGFHVLKRLPLAPDARVHLAHIAIKHSDAIGWRRGDRAVARRSREEARQLAVGLAERLKASPVEFAAAVQEHSDADDVVLGGDLGVWSRHEHAFQEFRLREAALRLEPGAVSDVIETPSGFHVVKRLPELPETLHAASVITILHSESQLQAYSPVARRSKQKATELAEDLLKELRKHPDRFDQRRVEYCELAYCDGVTSFYQGRGLPAIEHALASLAVGEIAKEPIEGPLGLLLLRKEDSAKVPPPAPAPIRRSFDDPSPAPEVAEAGDLQQSAPQMAEYMLGLGRYAQQKLKLSPSAAERFGEAFAALADKFSQQPDIEIDAELSRLHQQLLALLSPDELERFERHSRAWAALQKGNKTARP